MFTALLTKVLMGVGTAAVGWVGGQLGRLFGQKTASEAQKFILLRLDDAVATAVAAIEQTVRSKIAGTLSGSAADDLKMRALNIAKQHLGPDFPARASKVLGGPIEQILGDKIEAAVLSLKRK